METFVSLFAVIRETLFNKTATAALDCIALYGVTRGSVPAMSAAANAVRFEMPISFLSIVPDGQLIRPAPYISILC